MSRLHSFPKLTALALLESFRRMDLDADAIAAEAGVDLTVDANPMGEARERIEIWRRLWVIARRYDPRPALPTRAGLAIPFGALGLLDHLVGSAETVDNSMRALSEHMSAAASSVGFLYAPPLLEVTAHPNAGPETGEFSVALVISRLRTLAPSADLIAGVQLRQSRPTDDAGLHSRLIGAPVTFDQPRVGLRFHPGTLKMSFAFAEPTLHGSLRAAAARLGIGPGIATLESRIRGCLPELIAQGATDAASIAAAMGMSRRTLFRQLQRDGLRLQEILDRHRQQDAMRLLEADVPIIDVAHRLGYSDQAAFTRAFHRWTGLPPGQWLTARHGGQR